VIELRPAGLYCLPGDFYIDPWQPVDRAIITHAHPDRAVPGSRAYLTAADGAPLLAEWLGGSAQIQSAEYGESLTLDGCKVSLHPAGHILGSAQVRIEHTGEIWVVSGDYQLVRDPTCAPFEPVPCHSFVTESSFALPIFRWPAEAATIAAIHAWWRSNREAGRASVLFANPLGMAQRLLGLLDGPIDVHEEVERFSRHYRGRGIALPDAQPDSTLILAPPGTERPPRASAAMASGWMRIRGPRRRRSLDRGFVLSAHADWPALLQAVNATRAENIWVTGGQRAALVHWLAGQGRNATAIEAHFAEDE
jgi:putative mRNA 3-end processing factor